MIAFAVEVMDADDIWQDCSADCKSVLIDGLGLTAPRSEHSKVANLQLVFNNESKTYNPAIGADSSMVLLDNRRRVRIRMGGASLGNAVQLVKSGPCGLGGVTTITATGTTLPIGNMGGTTYRQAQSFKVTAGQLPRSRFGMGQNVGTPTGTITWAICADSGNKPGTNLQTGTDTPVANSTRVISGLSGTALVAGTVYWLEIYSTGAQSSGNYWQWQAQATSTYADGNVSQSTDGGTTWTDQPTYDAQCAITTSFIACWFGQSKSVSITAGDTITATWDAKAEFDSQHNNDMVRITTNMETSGNPTYTYTNKWVTYSQTFVTTMNATSAGIRFHPQDSGTGLNSRSIEYRNITLKVNGGTTILVNGDFASGSTSSWITTNVSAVSASISATVIPDYWIVFNGYIQHIDPDPFDLSGPPGCYVLAVDSTDVIRLKYNLNIDLQKNKRGDELNTLVLGLLPSGTLSTTLPGIIQDTGRQTFPTALNGYTKSNSSILDAVTDVSISEYGRQWFDRDGTFRWASRDFIPQRVVATPKLTLGPGMPFTMKPIRDTATLINEATLTWHPRDTESAVTVIAQITSPVQIPPVQAGGVPGSTTITLTFRDPITQKRVAGDDVVTPLVATTDYQIFEQSDGTGVEYTSSPRFTITDIVVAASQITLTLNNTATGILYATKLQVRGKAVTTYDPQTVTATDATSIAKYQERTYTNDLPFSGDQNFVTSLGNYLVKRFSSPFLEVIVIQVDFKAVLNGVAVMSIELMDVIAISDTQTGLNAVKHLVVGIDYQITPKADGLVGTIKFYLERLDDVTYWILGDPVYGVLGSTTRLYI